jgi:hypothetical protein
VYEGLRSLRETQVRGEGGREGKKNGKRTRARSKARGLVIGSKLGRLSTVPANQSLSGDAVLPEGDVSPSSITFFFLVCVCVYACVCVTLVAEGLIN